MRKVFTLLLMSIITSIGVWAQEQQEQVEVTASADFIVSDNGKTLTVSGKGDLTTLTTSITTTVFTNTAVGNVFVKNGKEFVSVTQGSDFSSSDTYYKEIVGKKTAIENTDKNPFLSNTTYVTSSNEIITSWNATKLNEQPLYYCVKNNQVEGFTWLLSAKVVTTASEDKYKADGVYAVEATSESFDLKLYVEGGNHKLYRQITGDELNAYLIKSTEFTAAKTIYASTDDTNFTKIEAGSTAVYNESATYYTAGSTTYDEYTAENLTELFTERNYIEKRITETKSFCNTLKDMVTSGSYERVIFVNEDAPTSLKINSNIINAILKLGDYQSNTTIKEVDFGATTFEGLGENTFKFVSGCTSLTTITIPLTKKTTVKKEPDFSAAENIFQEGTEEKMVVPAGILSYYMWNQSLTTLIIPDGYETIADGAFMNMGYLEKVVLPKTLEVIGTNAFNSCRKVTEIEFPSTLRIIKDAAFFNAKINDLKFNAGLYYIGNTAFGLDNAMKLNTIQIPASVKFIGACAFYGREYKDVYFLGENAPIMPIGTSTYNTGWTNCTAFPANILMGNNGFNKGTKGKMPTVDDMVDDADSGYANRENYHNNGYYFAILHFPIGLTDEQRAKYTDITRVYKTHRDAEGNFYYAQSLENPDSYDTVGKEKETLTFGACTASTKVDYGYEDTYLGSQYIWPSQQQWNRSYAVNSNGYNWDGVTKYRPTLSDEDLKVLAYAGYNQVTDEHPSTGDGYYTLDELKMIAHMGTRQFVLTNADTKKDENPEEEPVYPISMKGSNWWTICVPFNMTKAQVDKVFGEGTHVCRFSSVKRTEDSNGKNITLCFQNDVYATKWTRNPETLAYNKESGSPANDDIVIYSHEAYMIYPTKSSEDANNMYNIKDYKLETGSPLPTIIKANADDKTEGADHTEYRFVGNYVTEVSTGTATNADEGVATAAYQKVTIPQYSYIYATKKGYAAYKFWFFTGTQMAWSPNKCVVQATARDGGAQDYSNFFGGNANNSKVSQVSLFGEDGTVTEIENVTIIAGEGENAQIVYNLNGQVVSSNGNTDRLAKGVYIKGGKKFMVK